MNRLIVRLPNWVGDVVMTLPTLYALHAIGFELELFGKAWILDLLHAFPAKLHPLPKTLLRTRHELNRNPADKALLLTNSLSSALVMRLANKRLIGYQTDGRRYLLTKGMPKPHDLHEVETFWEIAKLATRTWLPEALWPTTLPEKIKLPLDPIYPKQLDNLLQKEKIRTPFIVLCPMATGTNKQNQSKIWPHWTELSRHLADRQILTICAPGPGEEQQARELLPQTKQVTGLSLAMLAALFNRAHFVLANDTGPLHIAAACQTDVLGIFGATDPQRTKPWGGRFLGAKDQWPTLEEILTAIIETINF
jgi:heptosyltransferase-2